MSEYPNWPRRRWISSLITAGVAVVMAGRSRNARAASDAPIQQPATPTTDAFIERAFAMRRLAEETGDQPFGAIVVRDGIIVGEAPSRVVVDRDPTAHAEMEAIRDAARRLGSRDLSGCLMYASSRPCPMCEAAAHWAGLDGLVHGAGGSDSGPPRLRRC